MDTTAAWGDRVGGVRLGIAGDATRLRVLLENGGSSVARAVVTHPLNDYVFEVIRNGQAVPMTEEGQRTKDLASSDAMRSVVSVEPGHTSEIARIELRKWFQMTPPGDYRMRVTRERLLDTDARVSSGTLTMTHT
jgi:hypothetical protein